MKNIGQEEIPSEEETYEESRGIAEVPEIVPEDDSKTYEEEAAAALAEESEGSYGDLLIEEFSAEHNAERISKIIKVPEKIATYIVAAAYFVVGVLCIAITDHIVFALPYAVGAMMTLIGLATFIVSLVKREYHTVNTNRTATSLIMTLLGIMILAQQFDPDSDPIMLISIVWGILGLIEGAHAFNIAFKRLADSQRFVYFFLKGIVECAVAFILLYRPSSERAHILHIVVFGINLIIDAITIIPKVREFLTAK